MTDATGDHLETEHKYDAEADFVLPGFDGLPGVDVTGPELHHLHATYYDTEDLALSGSRVTLRRRARILSSTCGNCSAHRARSTSRRWVSIIQIIALRICFLR